MLEESGSSASSEYLAFGFSSISGSSGFEDTALATNLLSFSFEADDQLEPHPGLLLNLPLVFPPSLIRQALLGAKTMLHFSTCPHVRWDLCVCRKLETI
eukprot:8857447-Pyramimonas_sp.AAC.1